MRILKTVYLVEQKAERGYMCEAVLYSFCRACIVWKKWKQAGYDTRIKIVYREKINE